MCIRDRCYIPRNHIIEDALENAVNGDMNLINEIHKLYNNPFDENEYTETFKKPSETNTPFVTFCGT